MNRSCTALAVTLLSTAAVIAGIYRFLVFNYRKDAVVDSPGFRNSVPLAILGDSSSHSYHDQIWFPETSSDRGGKFRPTTWQWTEILSQLRGHYVDQGQWGVWGTRIRTAETLDLVGWGGRTPRKQDYQFNFAVSGAGCQDLMLGYYRQAPRLLSLMNRNPERWKNGIVAIKIGNNTIDIPQALDRYAKEGVTPAVRSEILQCADWIRQAVNLIRRSHPHTRFVLVGIANDADFPPDFGFPREINERERENISSALDVFDSVLRTIAERDSRIVFFDDRAWSRRNWGGRGADGKPLYRTVSLGGRATVTNTRGDEPIHAIVADGHGGVVANALWAQQFVELLNSAFGLNIPLILTEEIAQFVDPSGALGLRPSP